MFSIYNQLPSVPKQWLFTENGYSQLFMVIFPVLAVISKALKDDILWLKINHQMAIIQP